MVVSSVTFFQCFKVKNTSIIFSYGEKAIIFAPANSIDPWCNGNTPVFGTVILGSSPSGSTESLDNHCIIKGFFIRVFLMLFNPSKQANFLVYMDFQGLLKFSAWK